MGLFHRNQGSSMSIQTSFKVSSKVGACDWPCFPKKSDYIDRENLSLCRVRRLEEVFDKIDDIFSATSLTPWIWALIPLIGIGVSIPLIITQQWFYLFVPFVGSQIIVQPLHAIYAIKRKRGLRRALTDWNRDVGSSQGVSLKTGLEHRVTRDREFDHALFNNQCYGRCCPASCCCINDAYIHLCHLSSA